MKGFKTMNMINTDTLIQFLLQQQTSEKIIQLNDAYKIFMNHLNINNRPGTIEAYQTCLKPVFKFFKANNIFNSNQITTDLINRFILERKPFVKNATINKEIISLKTMLNLMIKLKYIDKLSFEFQRLKVDKPIIESINKDDLIKIINYFNSNIKLNPKYKLIFFLMCTTGIRTTELLNIKNKNINLDELTIYLEFTKSHHTRYIFIKEELIPLIKIVMNDKTYLFNDEHGNQMTDNNLRLFFKHLKRDLKIENLSPHKLRHYFATTIYNKSLDIYLVSKLLGHTNIKTTEIYLDINDKNNQTKSNFYNPLNDLISSDPLTH